MCFVRESEIVTWYWIGLNVYVNIDIAAVVDMVDEDKSVAGDIQISNIDRSCTKKSVCCTNLTRCTYRFAE